MANRIEQIFLQPAMGVMAGDTGVGARLNPLMGSKKWCVILIVTTGTQITYAADRQSSKIRAMGLMARAAILCRRLMDKAITPMHGDLDMTAQTQRWLPAFEVTAVD
jgi:hypothetical protein